MKITAEQKERLQAIHSYEWCDDDPEVTQSNLDNILSKIDSPVELWYSSYIIPWSIEDGQLNFFVEHPLCDEGLALFIYSKLHSGSGDRATESTLETIDSKFKQGEYTKGVIAYSTEINLPMHIPAKTEGLELELDYTSIVFG